MRRGLRSRRPVSSARASDYYAADWSDSAYYQGPLGTGPTPNCIRLVGFCRAVPSTSTRILVSFENASVHGARLYTGHGGLPAIRAIFGGSGGYQTTSGYQFSSPNVGRLFVVHAWCDTVAHLAFAGAEIGSGTSAVTVTAPGGTARVTLGRYQHSTGYGADPDIGILAVSMSATPMTPSEVAADAAEIMSRSRGIALPPIPGEAVRWVARDIATGGNWRDRVGDDCTLTVTGSPTVTRVP